MGFLVATDELDITVLLRGLDVHPYDAFLPPDEYEAYYAAAREAARSQLLQQLQLHRDAQQQEQGFDPESERSQVSELAAQGSGNGGPGGSGVGVVSFGGV